MTEALTQNPATIVHGLWTWLSDDPFGAYRGEIVRGELVHDRPLRIQRYRRVEEIGDGHVLFISRPEAGRLERILAISGLMDPERQAGLRALNPPVECPAKPILPENFFPHPALYDRCGGAPVVMREESSGKNQPRPAI